MRSSAAALQIHFQFFQNVPQKLTAHLLVGALALHTDQCVTTQDCDFPSRDSA